MPLTDDGLVARYYVDEAASGTTPTHLLDGSGVGTDVDLAINYGSGNLAYTEVGGNRGLESIATTGQQRADAAVGTTKLAGFNGITKATIVLVVDVQAWTNLGSRIAVFNRPANGASQLGVDRNNGGWRFYFNNVATGQVSIAAGRKVVHIVYDTTQATAGDRVKVYVDGSLQTLNNPNMPTQNATADIASTDRLVCFNRTDGGSTGDRSFDGILYYLGVHAGVAFTQTQVDNDVTILADDDTPTGGETPVSNSLAIAYEAQASAQQSTAPAWEGLQPATLAAAASYEATAGVNAAQAPSWESQQTAAQSSAIAHEAAAGIASSGAPPWESLAGVDRAAALPWEADGVQENPVSASLALPWESVAGVGRTLAPPWESLASVLQALGLPYEAGASVAVVLVPSWETLQAAERSAALLWESLDDVAAVAVLAWEADGVQPTPGAVSFTFHLMPLAEFDAELRPLVALEAELAPAVQFGITLTPP